MLSRTLGPKLLQRKFLKREGIRKRGLTGPYDNNIAAVKTNIFLKSIKQDIVVMGSYPSLEAFLRCSYSVQEGNTLLNQDMLGFGLAQTPFPDQA